MKPFLYNLKICGKAGDGVKKAAQVIASTALDMGLFVFQYDDYQSLIKGGHSFSTVCISTEEVFNTYFTPDILICFDDRSIMEHQHEISEKGLIFCDADKSKSLTIEANKVPFHLIMKRHYKEETNVSISAVSIFFNVFGLSQEHLIQSISNNYRRNLEENISYSLSVYNEISKLLFSKPMFEMISRSVARKLYSGNQLIALGACSAGLKFYYGYPMTPASSILHYLASIRDSHEVYSIHAESELAAANMAVGSCFAGKRSAVGSSGGGIALMQEAFSLCGITEAPVLFVLSSRPGPATGVSTYTAQEDLYFAINQGHGEFPKIVASPDSFERAYSLAAELLELAWETQSPAILLTEKHLSECSAGVLIELKKCFDEQSNHTVSNSNPYERYTITDSGVSPLSFPSSKHGATDDVIKWNSHEHLPNGLRTDKAFDMIQMKDKRKRKYRTISEATLKYKRVEEYGEGDNLVFAYGSTALELREAMKYGKFKLIVPVYLEPFPFEELEQYMGMHAIVVEHSSTAMFAKFLIERIGIVVTKNVLRYDGRPWDPIDLAGMIRSESNA